MKKIELRKKTPRQKKNGSSDCIDFNSYIAQKEALDSQFRAVKKIVRAVVAIGHVRQKNYLILPIALMEDVLKRSEKRSFFFWRHSVNPKYISLATFILGLLFLVTLTVMIYLSIVDFNGGFVTSEPLLFYNVPLRCNYERKNVTRASGSVSELYRYENTIIGLPNRVIYTKNIQNSKMGITILLFMGFICCTQMLATAKSFFSRMDIQRVAEEDRQKRVASYSNFVNMLKNLSNQVANRNDIEIPAGSVICDDTIFETAEFKEALAHLHTVPCNSNPEV